MDFHTILKGGGEEIAQERLGAHWLAQVKTYPAVSGPLGV